MNKWVELILGIIILVGIILMGWASSTYSWTLLGKNFNLLNAAWILLKGFLFWIILLISFVLILLGISDLKE
jgi:hypothetical protein